MSIFFRLLIALRPAVADLRGGTRNLNLPSGEYFISYASRRLQDQPMLPFVYGSPGRLLWELDAVRFGT